MQATIAISKWVSSTLNDNGFDASRIKVKINELLPVAMAGEARKSVELWTGLYHVIPFDGYVCLYTYSQIEKKGHFFKSKLSSADMDPIDQPMSFEPEDVSLTLKNSRKASLSDPKFHKELNGVQRFIIANNGYIDPEQKIVAPDQPDLNTDDLDGSEPYTDHSNGADQGIKEDFPDNNSNEEQIGSVLVADLIELFDVLDAEIDPDHWANEVYRGLNDIEHGCIKVISKHVEFSNPDMQVNEPLLGNVLIKYNDSRTGQEPVMAIASLTDDGFYREVPYFISEENNLTVIGGELAQEDKWYFVADDYNSALSLYRATGIKTIAAAKGVDIGFVFNEILSYAPNAKVRYFRNEGIDLRPARLESLKYDAQYNIGHIFIDRELATWAEYSNLYFNEYGIDCDVEFKKLINEALQEYKEFIESN